MSERARVTSDEYFVSEWLQSQGVGVIPFGNNERGVLGLFAVPTDQALEEVGEAKGRDVQKKPLFLTSDPQNVDLLLTHHGISSQVSESAREIIGNLLTSNHQGEPLGIMMQADPSSGIPEGLYSTNMIKFKGETVPAIGLMVSGGDIHFKGITNRLNIYNKLAAGTSANLSGDSNSRGSGHTHPAGVLRDFGNKANTCVFVPPEYRNYKPSPSTSIAYVSNTGEEAMLMRIGSIPQQRFIDILKEAGVQNVINEADQVKQVDSYDYSAQDRLINWLMLKCIKSKLKEESVFEWNIPPIGFTNPQFA